MTTTAPAAPAGPATTPEHADGAQLSARPELVDVPMRAFVAIDGHGAPDSPEYLRAAAALVVVSGAARDLIAHRGRFPVHEVQPLETLWSPRTAGAAGPADRSWTLLVEQPATVTGDVLTVARIKAARSVSGQALTLMRCWRWQEGRVAQLLHTGPAASEAAAVQRLAVFVRASGLRPRGRLHEIHVDDPRTTAPEHCRTLVRRPVTPV